MFGNLDPNTCYVIRVASATKAGFGHFSEIEVRTKFEGWFLPAFCYVKKLNKCSIN